MTFVLGEGESKCEKEGEKGVVGIPEAAPGELCVYGGELSGASFDMISKVGGGESEGANRTGAMLVFEPPTEEAFGWGTYAVTGCDPTVGATAFPCP